MFGRMNFKSYTKWLWAFALTLILAVMPALAIAQVNDDPPPEKKTVYILGDIDGGMFTFPLVAYVTAADELIFAEQWYSRTHSLGPVGLAIDETNKKLFVSYESSALIEVFNAENADHLGRLFLVGTSNLAGMVVHQERKQLFVVDRGKRSVFVFDTATLAPVETWYLPSGAGAYGIDLMGNYLVVADGTSTVRYYDIDAHSEAGNFTLPYSSLAVTATEYPENTIYTTNLWSHNYLNKYVVSTATHEYINLGDKGKGLSINPGAGLVYVIVGFRGAANLSLQVRDMETLEEINRYPINSNWSPTDCLASFVQFGGTVEKTSPSHPDGEMGLGVQVTFELKVTNRHVKAIHELPLLDDYNTDHLTFVSANPAPDDTNNDGQIDWSDLVNSFSDDLDTGESFTVQAIFRATTEDCEEFIEGTNIAEMVGAKDIDGLILDNAAASFDYKINCTCLTDAECDDGLFCTGIETCNEAGECVSPGNPCPNDDGLFCNGQETIACDEELDECGHTGSPCADDGMYCNGEELCDELTQTCDSAGNPCVDDGLFCNGTETCNDAADICGHSGDPCPADLTCNEADDTCDGDKPAEEDPDDEGDYDPWPEGTVTGGCCGCGD